jgi:hypothetical protein
LRDDDLRGLLRKLIKLHPEADRGELQELYLAEVKAGPMFRASVHNEVLIDEALRRAFDEDMDRIERKVATVHGEQEWPQ